MVHLASTRTSERRKPGYVRRIAPMFKLESLLCALGSLAGYLCQANLGTMAIQNDEHENSAFDIVKAIDGKQYFSKNSKIFTTNNIRDMFEDIKNI